MFINFYIARPTYCFIFMYICGLRVVIKRICYVMLYTTGDAIITAQPTAAPSNSDESPR